MPRKKKTPIPTEAAAIDSYKHRDTRTRIPTQEQSVRLSARDKQPIKKAYQYDPSLDPQLIWSGKAEQGAEFGVSTVPIFVQEKIAPEAIIARLKQRTLEDAEHAQPSLFGGTAEDQIHAAVDFYRHDDNWQNRMILGDSLLVMNSLLEKEGLRGKVQTIYIDPPYGIKFGSNWQVSTRKRDVKDNKVDDMIRQPEQIKAFRDTWELGVHSYLSYLRDRLTAARELLTESGSCFVQISDENLHLVRNILDEVFGSENFLCQITFTKASGGLQSANRVGVVTDYIVWFAKNQDSVKYRAIYEKKLDAISSGYTKIELKDGTRRTMTKEEKATGHVPEGSRPYSTVLMTKPGPGSKFEVEFNGRKYDSGSRWWGTTPEGLKKIIEINRVEATENAIRFVTYFDDFPYRSYSNLWSGFGGAANPVYVVQTNVEIIKRCLLMTTDPGDIVLDPTCGSGTTAYVAEQWGRRWITTDTSRVALALARTRLMTAKFPYYKLKDTETKDLRSGFEYKTVPHVTLKSLANDEPAGEEVLYDQPLEQKDIVRVTGPFTVESLSPHRISDSQEMLSSDRFVETVVENLLKAGVQTGDRAARLEFVNLDIIPSGPEIQAVGEYQTADGLKKVALAVGPEFGSIDDDFIRDAASVAKKFADLLVVAGTAFEGSAFIEPSQTNGTQIMKVKINPDLSMGELLKKTGSGNLFLAFGEPDVRVREEKDGIVVEILGVDVYDPVKSEIRSSGSGDPEHDIAAWFIDTNYNSDAFFVHHAYFLGADKPYEKLKKALKADINEEVWDELHSTVSRSFAKPKTGKIAVKVINHYGDEVMKIITLGDFA